MLVGPIIAPLVGGILSQSYGWRATFLLLAVMALPIALLSAVVLPESHHYFALQNILSGDKENICKYTSIRHLPQVPTIKEASYITRPPLLWPWEILDVLLDLELLPYYITAGVHFAWYVCYTTTTTITLIPSLTRLCSMFTSLTTLPVVLAAEPYNLSQSLIGVAFLPVGVSMLLGAKAGGFLSDISSLRYLVS